MKIQHEIITQKLTNEIEVYSITKMSIQKYFRSILSKLCIILF